MTYYNIHNIMNFLKQNQFFCRNWCGNIQETFTNKHGETFVLSFEKESTEELNITIRCKLPLGTYSVKNMLADYVFNSNFSFNLNIFLTDYCDLNK